MKTQSGSVYAGAVWIVSALSLIAYAFISLHNQNIPGVEQLVDYLSTVKGGYMYIAAFLTIFIEGLYVAGSFFPGSTIVVLLSILSQTGGFASFSLTILAVFCGWCLAGAVNIIGAHLYGTQILKNMHNPDYRVVGRPWTTWFPSFRANYEVAQVADGGKPLAVFISSVWVKLLASIAMFICLALLPFFVDIHELENEDGVVSVLVVALISLFVGIRKIAQARSVS